MSGGRGAAAERRRPRLPALLGALAVAGLTAGSLLGPDGTSPQRIILVLDPLGQERAERAFAPLAEALEPALEAGLRLAVVRDTAGLREVGWDDVALVICPSAVAVWLAPELLTPLAAGVGRRPGPPRSRPVLLRRSGAPAAAAPWRDSPARTAIGDSLSLGLLGGICLQGRPAVGLTFGPDPYDHDPILHALRLGCFDYAVVSEAAADRFEAAGLLGAQGWVRRDLGPPVPEIVILAMRALRADEYLRLSDRLVGLGRSDAPPRERERDEAALRGLALVHLAGFQPLLEPELARLRERGDPCWPEVGF